MQESMSWGRDEGGYFFGVNVRCHLLAVRMFECAVSFFLHSSSG